jgi:hypothetical protein
MSRGGGASTARRLARDARLGQRVQREARHRAAQQALQGDQVEGRLAQQPSLHGGTLSDAGAPPEAASPGAVAPSARNWDDARAMRALGLSVRSPAPAALVVATLVLARRAPRGRQ